VRRITRARADRDALAAAADLVRRARRPFIVAGGGVYYSEAEAALRAFAERTGIAVGVTQAGKSTLSESHPLGLGGVGVTGTLAANRLAAEADLVLCLGTRLGDFTTASKTQFQAADVRFVAVNVHGRDAHKHGALPLVGDARAVLEELAEALAGHRVAADYAARVAGLREEWEREYQAIVHPRRDGGRLHASEVIRVLNEELGEDATIVHASGGLPGDLQKLWKSKAPGDYHSEYGYSCMGYEIAGALGVKMARPEREVYALAGDGSYLMLSQEIVTSVQEGRKLTVVLFDNHGFDCIQNLQRSCGSAGFGNEFRGRDASTRRLEGPVLAIDYVANARSLGAATFCAEGEEGLRRALAQARQEPATALVYVPVEPHTPLPGYSWWDVPVSQASGSEAVRAARARYDEAVTRRRFHY
jgi:3D-(3,5/4)-trihydroxycyclohexane-1,2-dione acylhydrolase (decyclizing)